MTGENWYWMRRIAAEPPFRVVARAVLQKLARSAQLRSRWDISPRPPYLLGMLAAAHQARKQRVAEISVVEFGVAGGNGLLAMQREAEAIERETGIGIRVFGFDMGDAGLPVFVGDYRDHPEEWQPGDFPMNVDELKSRLSDRTRLVLGNISETVPGFFERFQAPPLGFVSIDLDLYSSSARALDILVQPNSRMLWHMPMYFDDVGAMFNHAFAGELLAIAEFNANSAHVKIDRWHGVCNERPFPERPYLKQMYVAHDIKATSAVTLARDRGVLPLEVR
jgi:hypothetical protein